MCASHLGTWGLKRQRVAHKEDMRASKDGTPAPPPPPPAASSSSSSSSSSSPATRLSCRWLLFTRHSWTRRRFLCSGLFRTTRRYGPLYVIVVVLAARFRALGFGRRHIIYMVWMPSSAPAALVQSQYCRTTTVGLWLKLLPPTSFWY